MTNPPPFPPYRYRCEDRSRLTAWLGRTVVPWVERRLPARMPANHVTLCSSACLLGTTWLCAGAGAGVLAVLAGILLLAAYTVLDMVDGQRARRLGTSSPLGEYLDHALDVLNAALVVFVVIRMQAEWKPVWFAGALIGVNLAFVATLLEQKLEGVMRLGAVGPVEGLAVAGTYLATWLLPGAGAWWGRPWAGGIDRADVMVAIGVFLVLAGAVATLARLRRVPGVLIAFAAGQAAMVAAYAAGVPSWPAVLSLAAGAVDYGGRLITSHLQGRKGLPWPDGIAPALLLAAGLNPDGSGPAAGLAWLAFAWLGAKIVLHAAGTLRLYRMYWTWWHPPGR